MTIKIDDLAKDSIAKIVMQRTNRAQDSVDSRVVFQNKSFSTIIQNADLQYRGEYTPETAAKIQSAFGFCPTRHCKLVTQKTNAARAWKRDLVINHMDHILSAVPTPEPELDDASRQNIRESIQRDLQERLIARGGGLSDALVDHKGDPAPEVIAFMRREAGKLKEVEQARMVSVAAGAAKRADRKLMDQIVQGGFRTAYGMLTHNQFLYGIGFARFPHWEKKAVINHKGKRTAREYEMRPTFRSIHPSNMLCVNDNVSLHENTANIEKTSLTKSQLIRMATDKRYDKKQIEEIVTEFSNTHRNWLNKDFDRKESTYWGPDEPIDALIHEGFMNGSDLIEHGITGVQEMEVYNVHAVIVGGRTILCEAMLDPKGADRTYIGVPFNRFGDGIYDVLGMGAALHDIEEQVNILMHTFENNIDWSARPPLMANSTVFEVPGNAKNIVPGKMYEVADAYTGGSMPEPLRPMKAVTAQYHLIMSQIDNLIRKADEASGLPAFAYSSQDMGRASLGEYSQRISNALRVIKEAAIEEDIAFEPAWRTLFNYMLENEEGFSEGQDIDLSFRGITGLLAKDLAAKERMAMLGLIQQGVDRQSLPKQVEEFAYRQMIDDAGYPTEALGLDDALLDKALASAASGGGMGAAGLGTGQQTPQLDGRSGAVAPGAVAAANGASTY